MQLKTYIFGHNKPQSLNFESLSHLNLNYYFLFIYFDLKEKLDYNMGHGIIWKQNIFNINVVTMSRI